MNNNTLPVMEIINELTETYNVKVKTLSRSLNVSESTINRWQNSNTNPRPELERSIRELYSSYKNNTYRDFKEVIDDILLELREILHRRGRVSSRNEALDQLSSILFAHVISVIKGERGISTYLSEDPESSAIELRRFVNQTIRNNIPIQLSYELSVKDFELKIKDSENELAQEIINIFTKNNAYDLFKTLRNKNEVDIFNDIFGRFLASSFIDEKELGQYLTPIEIVKPMIILTINNLSAKELDLLCHPEKCKEFGLILDPSCGVSSFLTELLKYLLDLVISKHGEELSRVWLVNMARHVLVGIDKSERMIRLSLANFSMLGLTNVNLHLLNGLSFTDKTSGYLEEIRGEVKIILSNPPFGAEFKGNDLLYYKLATEWTESKPTKVDSELLFIERYLNWLDVGGQAIVIVPDSILTNKAIFHDLRKNMANMITLNNIISLPSETFSAAGTTTKTSILHFTKAKNEDNHTYFAICNKIGYTVTKKGSQKIKVPNSENDLFKVVNELGTNDHINDIRFGRFLKNIENEERWDANYHISLPINVLNRITNPMYEDLFIKDVAELVNQRINPNRWGTETFDYVEISDIDGNTFKVNSKKVKCSEAPSRARKLVQTGDIVYSTVRPDRGTVGIIPPELNGAICTTGLAVLRPFKIDSLTLAVLLRTENVITQIMRFNVGIAYPAIEEACIPNILLPINKSHLIRFKEDSKRIMNLEETLYNERVNFNAKVKDAISTWISN